VSDEISLERALNVIFKYGNNERDAAPIYDKVLRGLVAPYHRSLFWGDRLMTLDKSAAFRSDPSFAEAMKAVASSTGENQYDAPDKISWRIHTLVWAGLSALKVSGQFVECGVFRGDMSWVLTEMVDLVAAGKTLYLYDTFSGFDQRYSSEADFPEAPQIFDVIDSEYKAPGIYEFVVNRFAKKPYVKVIRGVVPDVLLQDAPNQIAMMHIDLNSPGAERGALEVLFDRVSRGGIIVFDDYGWILHRKQKEVVDEFMNNRGYYVLELPTGQGLSVVL
jgi:O-methyltransferase